MRLTRTDARGRPARARLITLVGATAALLAVVPAAQASTASFSGGTLTVTAGPGEANDVTVEDTLFDTNTVEDLAGITAGPAVRPSRPRRSSATARTLRLGTSSATATTGSTCSW